MDDTPIDGAPLPVRSNTRWHKVVWPLGTIPLHVVPLSRGFSAAWTHHWSGKTTPCDGDAVCADCRKQLPRYQAFMPAWSGNHKDIRVCLFSEFAARQMLGLIDRFGSLRGRKIRLVRRPGKRNAPVDVLDDGPVALLDQLPPAFCPWGSVLKFWGITHDWRPKLLPKAPVIGAMDNAGAEIVDPWGSSQPA